MRSQIRYTMLTVLVLFAACGPSEKTAPLPPTDLKARAQVLEEVKQHLETLKTAQMREASHLLTHSDHRVRAAAAERLMVFRDLPDDIVARLTKTAGDENVSVRIAALRGLTAVGDERAVDPVIRALADTDSKVRKWAYKGLKKLENIAVPTMLHHVMTKSETASLNFKTPTHQQETLSDVLLTTLSEMGSAAVPYLVELLKNPENGPVVKAVSVLGKIGPGAGDSVPTLLRLIDSTSDKALKKNAIDAIANIGDMDPEVMPKLMELSQDSDSVISGAATAALKKLEQDT